MHQSFVTLKTFIKWHVCWNYCNMCFHCFCKVMLGVFNWFCDFEYSPFIVHNFNSDYIGNICFKALADTYFIYYWPLYSSLYIRTDKFNIIWATTNKVACSKSQTKRVCTQEIIKRYNSLLTFTSPHILNFEHGAH